MFGTVVVVGLLVILGLAAIGGIIYTIAGSEKGVGIAVTSIATILLLIIGFFSGMYTQKEGEAKVLRSFTGKVVGQDTDAGMAWKAPWVKAVAYDVKNKQIEYNAIGFTDKDGASGSMSLHVTYSLRSDMVANIDKEYQSQTKFENDLVAKDVGAAIRTVPGKHTAVEILGNRDMISKEIHKALDDRWDEEWGVTGIQIALGPITFDKTIMDKFNELAAEKTNAQKAILETKTAEETAKQQVAKARGENEANKLREKSLTPAVLESQRIEMLKEVGKGGNLIITDGKSSPLINIPAK